MNIMSELKPARILAIETSCDETACAILENERALLSSTVASQMDIHARYAGVFPEVASRQHVLSIIPVVEETLTQSNLTLNDIDAVCRDATCHQDFFGVVVACSLDRFGKQHVHDCRLERGSQVLHRQCRLFFL